MYHNLGFIHAKSRKTGINNYLQPTD